jgi:hypothetical protein
VRGKKEGIDGKDQHGMKDGVMVAASIKMAGSGWDGYIVAAYLCFLYCTFEEAF